VTAAGHGEAAAAAPEGDWRWSFSTWVLAITALAAAVKLPFAWYLGGRFYPDVNKAVNFGALLHRGAYAFDTDVINNKTLLGPLLCFALYDRFGPGSLALLNLGVVLALCATQVALGRGHYAPRVVLAALVLMAFYTGTNRNVVAGEPEDNLAALCLAVGVLVHVRGGPALLAGLLVGVGVLFKYWVGIFGLGFALPLALQRRWRTLAALVAGMAAPFAVLSVIDGGTSLRGILVSERFNRDYTGWRLVAFKMVSTGMLFALVASAWGWWRRRDDERSTLYFCLATSFVAYVVVTGHAWPANFVMMACLVFSGFLIAEALLPAVDALPLAWRRPALVATAAAWVVVNTALTAAYLDVSARPIALLRDRDEAQHMFPYNPPP
jgi:hypothetical protein